MQKLLAEAFFEEKQHDAVTRSPGFVELQHSTTQTDRRIYKAHNYSNAWMSGSSPGEPHFGGWIVTTVSMPEIRGIYEEFLEAIRGKCQSALRFLTVFFVSKGHPSVDSHGADVGEPGMEDLPLNFANLSKAKWTICRL